MFHLVFTTVVLAETSGPVLRVSQDTEGGHPIVGITEENDKFGMVCSDLCNFNNTFQEECYSLCLRKIQSFTCYMKYK